MRVLHACGRRFGGVDLLVNVVGVISPAGLADTTEEVWRRTMDVNATSMFLTCKHAVPFMLKAGGSSIVNIGSLSSVRHVRPEIAYSTSKAAVNALTTSVALEYAKMYIRSRAPSVAGRHTRAPLASSGR